MPEMFRAAGALAARMRVLGPVVTAALRAVYPERSAGFTAWEALTWSTDANAAARLDSGWLY